VLKSKQKQLECDKSKTSNVLGQMQLPNQRNLVKNYNFFEYSVIGLSEVRSSICSSSVIAVQQEYVLEFSIAFYQFSCRHLR